MHELGAVGHFVQHGAFRAQLQAALIHIIELGELADFDGAFRGRQLADDGFEQGGFAQAIASAHADALAVFKREGEAGEQGAFAHAHAEVAQFHGAVAELGRRRNDQFDVFLNGRAVLRGDFVVAVKTVLRLAALGARAGANPGEFALQKHLALVLHHGVAGLALGFVEQVIGVIAVVPEKPAVA